MPREERGDEAPAAGLARPVSGSSVPSTLPQSGSVNAISAAGEALYTTLLPSDEALLMTFMANSLLSIMLHEPYLA